MKTDKEIRTAWTISDEEPKGRQELEDFELDDVDGGALNKTAQKWWNKNKKKVKKQLGADAYTELMDELTNMFLDPTKHSLTYLKSELEDAGVNLKKLK